MSSDFPYVVTRKYGKPRYARSFVEAKRMMIDDLDSLDMALAYTLKDSEAAAAIRAAKAEVDRMSERGGSLDPVVDPYTGMRYRVTVTKRDPL